MTTVKRQSLTDTLVELSDAYEVVESRLLGILDSALGDQPMTGRIMDQALARAVESRMWVSQLEHLIQAVADMDEEVPREPTGDLN